MEEHIYLLPKITVCQAEPEDAKGISDIITATWLATYPNKDYGITIDDIKELLKIRESPEEIEKIRQGIIANKQNQKTFVARYCAKIIGFCSVIKKPEFNQLKAIYILPEYQNKGIGKKLMTQALDFCNNNNNKIIVRVAEYNQNAIRFYKKFGFTESGNKFSDERFRMKSGSIIPEVEFQIERNCK